MEFEIIERNAFQVFGIKNIFKLSEESNLSNEINEFWENARKNGTINQLYALNTGDIDGLIGITIDNSDVKNELEYWITVDSNEQLPEEFLRFEIPASKWAVFEVIGPVMDTVPKTWEKIYSEWFPANNYEYSGAPALEVYKSIDPTYPLAITELWVPIK